VKTVMASVSVALALLPMPGYGQESLVGRYVGSFVVSSAFPGRPERTIRLELVIESAENGVVKGVGISQSKNCAGAAVPIVGEHRGAKLELRAAEERTSCSMQHSLVIEGNKLTGTTRSGYPVTLTKQ